MPGAARKLSLLRGDRWLVVLTVAVVAAAGTLFGILGWHAVRDCESPAERLSEFPQASVDPKPRVALSVTVGENAPAYAFDADSVVMGAVAVVSYRGVVAGFDLTTGEPLWQRDLNKGRDHRCDSSSGRLDTPTVELAASPAGLVVVDSDLRLPEHLVHVLDVRTGEERNKFSLRADLGPRCRAMAKNILVCDDVGMYRAFDVSSGEVLWTRSSGDWESLTRSHVDRNFIFYGVGGSEVRRLDLKTGEKLPSLELPAGHVGKEIIAARSGRVAVALEDGSAVALSTESGERVWHRDDGAAVTLVVDGTSYTSRPDEYMGDKGGETEAVDVVARDLHTGKKMWRKESVSVQHLRILDFTSGIPVTESSKNKLRLWNLRTGRTTEVLRRFEGVAPAYAAGPFTAGSHGPLVPFVTCEGSHEVTPTGESGAESTALCETKRVLLLNTST